MELAYAGANPNIVYASVQMTWGAIWRSGDGGASYQPRATLTVRGATPAQYLGNQGWYGNAIWAGDPTDENLVIAGGIDLWRSTDGGNLLAEISTWWAHPPSPHADQHAIVAHPVLQRFQQPDDVLGQRRRDMGPRRISTRSAWRLTAPFVNGWAGLDNSFGVTQFYSGAGHADSGKLIGGAQADGTLCFDPQQGPQKWTTIFGGDGGWCAADPTDPDVFFTASTSSWPFTGIPTGGASADGGRGPVHRRPGLERRPRVNGTGNRLPHRIPDAIPVKPGQPLTALFIAPFVLDPNQPERILAGGMSLWRTNDAKTPNTPTSGPSWQSIKNPIVTTGDARRFGISALAVAPGDSDTIWVGHGTGTLFLTSNGTAGSPTWQPGASGSFPPQRYCTRIAVDATQKNVVYVAFGGYMRGNLWVTRKEAGRGATCPPPCPPRRYGR